MPPNATTGTTIKWNRNSKRHGYILPNGLAIDKGQSLIVTDGDDGASRKTKRNAPTPLLTLVV